MSSEWSVFDEKSEEDKLYYAHDHSDSEDSVSSYDFDSEPESDIISDTEWESSVDSEWSETCSTARSPNVYSDTAAVKMNICEKEDPLEYYEYFIDDVLVDLMVTETNRYAEKYLTSKKELLEESWVKQWKPTTSGEMQTFLALLQYQSLCVLPENSMYFSRGFCAIPAFLRNMKATRFALLMKFLRFNSSEENPEGIPAKLYNIHPVLCHLEKKFQQAYVPGQHLSLNETLLNWNGVMSKRHYRLLENGRFGFRSYALCEAKTGYVFKFCVFNEEGNFLSDEHRDLHISARMVMTIMKDFLDKGHILHVDKLMTSTELFEKLLTRQTDCIGSVYRKRKGMPRKLREGKLGKNEVKTLYKGNLMAMRYRGWKNVYILSSIYSGKFNGKKTPEVFAKYSERKGIADISDEFMVHNNARKLMRKYYMKQFRHLLDVLLVNCFVLYKKNGGKAKTLSGFNEKLVSRLFEKYTPGGSEPGSSRSLCPTRLDGQHFPNALPSNKKVKKPRLPCLLCGVVNDENRDGGMKKTRFYCRECNVPLCVDPCFRIYHTDENLTLPSEELSPE